jgi:hypothetical protein
MKLEKKIKEIELGKSWWVGISFTAGCFGFGWIPFAVIIIIFIGFNE